MIIKVDINTMEREFKQYDRDYFSLDGYQFLLDFYDDLYPDGDYELDVIGICSEWTEYGPYAELSITDFIDDYGYNLDICDWVRDNVPEFSDIDDDIIEEVLNKNEIDFDLDEYVDDLVEASVLLDRLNVIRLSNSDIMVADY